LFHYTLTLVQRKISGCCIVRKAGHAAALQARSIFEQEWGESGQGLQYFRFVCHCEQSEESSALDSQFVVREEDASLRSCPFGCDRGSEGHKLVKMPVLGILKVQSQERNSLTLNLEP
jgi:hypothetical protein